MTPFDDVKKGESYLGVILLFMCYFGLLFFYMYLDIFCVWFGVYGHVDMCYGFEVGMNLLLV